MLSVAPLRRRHARLYRRDVLTASGPGRFSASSASNRSTHLIPLSLPGWIPQGVFRLVCQIYPRGYIACQALSRKILAAHSRSRSLRCRERDPRASTESEAGLSTRRTRMNESATVPQLVSREALNCAVVRDNVPMNALQPFLGALLRPRWTQPIDKVGKSLDHHLVSTLGCPATLSTSQRDSQLMDCQAPGLVESSFSWFSMRQAPLVDAVRGPRSG